MLSRVQSALLVHKSDVGGVQLGLSDADAVKAGFHTIMEAASRRVAHEEIDGVLVQPMARPGTELIVGIDTDADFGPVFGFGDGWGMGRDNRRRPDNPGAGES